MNFVTFLIACLISGQGEAQNQTPSTRAVDGSVAFANTSGQLYRVDFSTQTPQVSLVGHFGAQITDLAMTRDGQLYGVSFDTLYLIDQSSGNAQRIGQLGVRDINGLAASGTRLLASSIGGSLFYVDRNSGHATRAGAFGSSIRSSGDLCYGPNGSLYMTSPTGNNNQGPDQLVRVDEVSGNAIPIGSTGFGQIYGMSTVGGRLIGFTEGGEILQINSSTGGVSLIANVQFAFWGSS